MDLTQILTMSAMQGGDNVDPMQIMMMTQLLKDQDVDEDGAGTADGSKSSGRQVTQLNHSVVNLKTFRVFS